MARIEELLREDVAGDPMSGLRWTRKTTEKVAGELNRLGVEVSPNTVGRLLTQMGFSLKTARKNIESGFKPQPGHRERRDEQFLAIKKTRQRFERAGLPIISIDCKKKEMVGNFKNNGTTWCREPKQVNDHDFRSDATGMAVPYGIYDVQRNSGIVVVGTSRETPAFAADAVEQWWAVEGRKRYSKADKLLLLADCGGGNSARARVWKRDLQHKLCNRHGLKVTVCHYPPGASKWNPIEHRLFSEISKNWSGIPLDTYETVVKHISTTTTSQGLHVEAILHSRVYETGEKVTDAEMATLRCRKHKKLPQWNYTITPLPNN
jgi:hypothetical protein